MKLKSTLLTLFVALLVTPLFSLAQIVTIESGRFYTALAHDASGNLYTTRYDVGSDRYQVVKYVEGAGAPQVLVDNITYAGNAYAWGLAVAPNGDLYVASNADNNIIRLPYNSGSDSYGATETVVTGNYYSALAIDGAGNLYTLEYAAATSDYAIVRYPSGSNTGTQLYHGLLTGPGFQYPTGLAIAANGDIFVTDGFDGGSNMGAVYRFTAESNYTTRTTVSTGTYPTSLALDPMGNLYVSEYNGSTFVLNRYDNAAGAPTEVETLELGSNFYPWGIIALNSTNVYFATGSSGDGGALNHLLDTPEITATAVSFSNVAGSSATLNWTNGSGVHRTVFMLEGNAGIAAPVSGTSYTANAEFGSGSQIGASGWYAVYSGTANLVEVTGLSETTTYRVMVVEDNGDNFYQVTAATGNPANITTVALPVTFGSILAELNEGALKVQWTTMSEMNNDHFEVQASIDGKNFKTIETVRSKAANGNSDRPLYYQTEKFGGALGLSLIPLIVALFGFQGRGRKIYKFAGLVAFSVVVIISSCTKDRVDTKGVEKIYIRIAQVDKDGTTRYSKVVTAVQKN